MSDLTTPFEPDLAGLSKMVLAGEDPAELAKIIRALVADLRPRSYLEYRQVELIAQTDFEINRNRRRVPEVERKMLRNSTTATSRAAPTSRRSAVRIL